MIWNQLSWFAVPALSLWILGVLLAQRKGSPAPAFLATLAGWLVLSVFIGLLWRDLGRPPIRTMGETRLLFASALSLIGLLTALRTRYLWLLSFSNLIASVFLFILILSPGMQSGALMPALQSAWFPPHVACYITSYSILGVATLLSLKQIRDNRKDGSWRLMPVLDAVVRLGFAFLVLGLITGAVWAKQAWGDYWAWDPKETWAFITVSAYLVYIHLRARRVLTRGTLGLLTVAFLLGLYVIWKAGPGSACPSFPRRRPACTFTPKNGDGRFAGRAEISYSRLSSFPYQTAGEQLCPPNAASCIQPHFFRAPATPTCISRRTSCPAFFRVPSSQRRPGSWA